MRTTARLAAALLLLGAARAASAGEEPAPVPPAAPGGAAAPVTAPSAKDEELRKLTDDMLVRIGEIRKLKMKAPVERRWTTRDQMKKDMLAEMDKEMPPEKAKEVERALAFFGLLKEGTDLREMFSSALASGVAGYYLPDKKVFFLVEGFNSDGSRPIVFHELTHAVEDQYYDYFDQMKKWTEGDQSDRANAVKAVVEGSAQLYTQRFLDSEPGAEDRFFAAMMAEAQASGAAQAAADVPPFFIIEVQFFPYHNGSRFLNRVLPKLPAPAEGEDPMARLYSDPPSSSEMILHPEKYLGERDLPQDAAIPSLGEALGEGWKKDFEDTMGELSTGIVLNTFLAAPSMEAQLMSVAQPPEGGIKKQADLMKLSVGYRGKTGTATAGWDGDRYALYSNGERLCLGWATTWDTEQDAAEFAEIYGAVVAKKYGFSKKAAPKEGEAPAPDPAGPWAAGDWKGTRWAGTRGGDTAIVAKGLSVLVAERVPPERLEKFVLALGGTKFTRDPKDALPAVK